MIFLETIHFFDILVHFLRILLFPDPAILTHLIFNQKINFKLLNASKSIKLV